MRVVKDTGHGDEQQSRNAPFDRSLFDNVARCDGAQQRHHRLARRQLHGESQGLTNKH